MVTPSENEVENDTTAGNNCGFQDPACHLVSADEFRELLISRSSLERIDIGDPTLAGLRDKRTGRRFVVNRQQLGVLR